MSHRAIQPVQRGQLKRLHVSATSPGTPDPHRRNAGDRYPLIETVREGKVETRSGFELGLAYRRPPRAPRDRQSARTVGGGRNDRGVAIHSPAELETFFAKPIQGQVYARDRRLPAGDAPVFMAAGQGEMFRAESHACHFRCPLPACDAALIAVAPTGGDTIGATRRAQPGTSRNRCGTSAASC
jgi:hypothetical protein